MAQISSKTRHEREAPLPKKALRRRSATSWSQDRTIAAKSIIDPAQETRIVDNKNIGDDELVFVGETGGAMFPPPKREKRLSPWQILIVDDDPDVHTTTTFALRGTEILGRPLSFLHAESAAQACEILATGAELAVILLDVVMEQEDSGLKLVHAIRKEFNMSETRIILRTGQPGYAPEMDAIRDYDINDYKTKSELTRNKLFTTLTAAIRSYRQIRTINTSRRGLDMIVHATGELLAL